MLLFCFAKSESACILYLFAIREAKERLSRRTTLWFSKGRWFRWYPCGISWGSTVNFCSDARCCQWFREDGWRGSGEGGRILYLASCHGVMAWLCFFLCDLLTRPHVRAHTRTTRTSGFLWVGIQRWLAWIIVGSHTASPGGWGVGLAAHQILCFSSLTHFCSTPKTLVSPVLWKESCVVWVTFRWWWRQSNVYHSLCRSHRGAQRRNVGRNGS